MTDFPTFRPRCHERIRTPFQRDRTRWQRIKTAQLRERAAGADPPALELDRDQKRAIALECRDRGWQLWEVEALVGEVPELVEAWYAETRRAPEHEQVAP